MSGGTKLVKGHCNSCLKTTNRFLIADKVPRGGFSGGCALAR